MSSPQFHHSHLVESLRREVGWTIANRIRDPRVPAVTTVTEVRLSPDKRNATVFVSVFGDGKEKKGALIALNRASAYIQRTVASRVTMKNFPKMQFRLDNSLDNALRINQLLKEVGDDLV